MENAAVHSFQFIQSLLNDAVTLPHLTIAHQVTIIYITGTAYWNFEIKFVVRTVRTMYTHIVIYSCSTQVRACHAPVQRTLCADSTCTDTTIHEDTVTGKQGFKLFQHCRKSVHEIMNFFPGIVREVALKASDTANIGRKTGATDAFIDLIYLFAPLEYIGKRS
ncbi:hypothetical protein D3C72_583570 [compost metagenome]